MAPMQGQDPATATQQESTATSPTDTMSSTLWTVVKLTVAAALFVSSISNYASHLSSVGIGQDTASPARRRLLNVDGSEVPSYMNALMDDLVARKKLFDETPPDEVKYWFEYTGPLQVCYAPILSFTQLFLKMRCMFFVFVSCGRFNVALTGVLSFLSISLV